MGSYYFKIKISREELEWAIVDTEPVSGSFIHLLEGISRENIKITDVKITPLTYKPLDSSYVHE